VTSGAAAAVVQRTAIAARLNVTRIPVWCRLRWFG